jgi:hypothetical protein
LAGRFIRTFPCLQWAAERGGASDGANSLEESAPRPVILFAHRFSFFIAVDPTQ